MEKYCLTRDSPWEQCLLQAFVVGLNEEPNLSTQFATYRVREHGILIKDTKVVGFEPWYPRSPWYLPTKGGRGRLVGFRRILGSFQLDLKPLHADLEAVHRLDRCLRARRIVIRHEACE